MSQSVKILFKNRHVALVYKPEGVPSQPDPTNDADAMSITSKLLFEQGEPHQLWLVHRLDRTVGGLLVFARSKRAAAAMSKLVASGGISKKYVAVCRGECAAGVYRDMLFKDSSTNKAYVVNTQRKGAKEAELICNPKETVAFQNEKLTLAEVTLITGRFHQIRAQFSSRKTPLVGDRKYGGADGQRRMPALFAASLAFELFGEQIQIEALPELSEYPWCLFSKDSYILNPKDGIKDDRKALL